MTKYKAGVWIDHRKALVVVATPAGERTTLIISKVEKHPQRSGDSPLKGRYAADQVPADDSRQKAYTGELNIYYAASVLCVRTQFMAMLIADCSRPSRGAPCADEPTFRDQGTATSSGSVRTSAHGNHARQRTDELDVLLRA